MSGRLLKIFSQYFRAKSSLMFIYTTFRPLHSLQLQYSTNLVVYISSPCFSFHYHKKKYPCALASLQTAVKLAKLSLITSECILCAFNNLWYASTCRYCMAENIHIFTYRGKSGFLCFQGNRNIWRKHDVIGKEMSHFTDNMYFWPPCGLLYKPLHKVKQGGVTEAQRGNSCWAGNICPVLCPPQ